MSRANREKEKEMERERKREYLNELPLEKSGRRTIKKREESGGVHKQHSAVCHRRRQEVKQNHKCTAPVLQCTRHVIQVERWRE